MHFVSRACGVEAPPPTSSGIYAGEMGLIRRGLRWLPVDSCIQGGGTQSGVAIAARRWANTGGSLKLPHTIMANMAASVALGSLMRSAMPDRICRAQGHRHKVPTSARGSPRGKLKIHCTQHHACALPLPLKHTHVTETVVPPPFPHRNRAVDNTQSQPASPAESQCCGPR